MISRPYPPFLLDGPTGTELERRGFTLPPPLWSAAAIDRAPDVLETIHRAYLAAGATVITANTFRTNPTTLAHIGGSVADAARISHQAVAIARRAVEQRNALVAGSVAPVGDSYRPGDRRSDNALRRDHALHIEHLVSAGCDLLLLETMNSLSEALIALEEASKHNLPVVISLVTDRSGLSILDGTDLGEGVMRIAGLEPRAILLNCASPEATARGVEALGKIAREEGATWTYGGYPNSGDPDPERGWDRVTPVSDRDFDRAIERCLDAGATWVGSCCGTTPATTARIRLVLDRRHTPDRG